jgi:hypothetical protein
MGEADDTKEQNQETQAISIVICGHAIRLAAKSGWLV